MSTPPFRAPLFRMFQNRFSTSGVSAMFAPRKPRHPLTRLLFGLLGLVVLALLLVVGVFVGAAMLVGGLLVRLLRQRGKPITARKRVVDGEYRVVPKAGQPLLR
jgi:hypothetical protein